MDQHLLTLNCVTYLFTPIFCFLDFGVGGVWLEYMLNLFFSEWVSGLGDIFRVLCVLKMSFSFRSEGFYCIEFLVQMNTF